MVAPYRSLAEPVADVIGPIPYTAQQGMLDPLWSRATLTYWRSGFLPGLSDAVVDTLLDQAWPNGPTEIHLHHLGGTVARYGDDHAAYRNREAAFAYNLLAKWADPAEEEACRSWARSADERVERFGTGAAYLNFLPAEGRSRCGPRLAPMRTPGWSRSRTATTRATCSGLTTTSVPAADRTD